MPWRPQATSTRPRAPDTAAPPLHTFSASQILALCGLVRGSRVGGRDREGEGVQGPEGGKRHKQMRH